MTLDLDFHSTLYLIGLIAVFVFALTGALAAAKRELDILAFVFVGIATGIGGGTIRDLLLRTDQIFWIADPNYLTVCIVASVMTYFFAHWVIKIDRILLWMDAAGIALFAVLGTSKALSYEVAPLIAILMGVISSTLGSAIRDLMIQVKLVIFEPEIYVTACLLGSLSYVVLSHFGINEVYNILLSSAAAFLLRVLAIELDLRFPSFTLSKLQNREIRKQQHKS
ncbi:trimeric intracellular cation channel family protein [Agarivorans sp. B2Z047]|uniref:trimeric intracellular cation channel family protein n=1 Tax=Agarivorans sp. B2Z047 TaxID=2652721 RepID=UPI00128E77C9|nr:trimeric intracellular cation channel family protein [Agarivorans sp. B2Z047]MPW29156.1 trimeric intracellular cation channel family protein [Agarivorans sp. B2Z047]UQN41709.1 trimeric intracellular cation channel family protein [Agarivorans sp. B2Z047]